MSEGKGRPCGGCDRGIIPRRGYDLSQCRICWLYHNDPTYRAFYDEGEYVPPKSRRFIDCTHRGEQPTREEECASCNGRVRIVVYFCTVYGECTIGKKIATARGCCQTCDDYEEKT